MTAEIGGGAIGAGADHGRHDPHHPCPGIREPFEALGIADDCRGRAIADR